MATKKAGLRLPAAKTEMTLDRPTFPLALRSRVISDLSYYLTSMATSLSLVSLRAPFSSAPSNPSPTLSRPPVLPQASLNKGLVMIDLVLRYALQRCPMGFPLLFIGLTLSVHNILHSSFFVNGFYQNYPNFICHSPLIARQGKICYTCANTIRFRRYLI